MLDNNAPQTMMLLGAVISLAKRMLENDLTSNSGEVVLNSKDKSNAEQQDAIKRSDGAG